MLHDCGESKGADKRDRKRVGYSTVMLIESVFANVEFQTVIQFFEKASAHEVAFVNDDGILAAELAKICESRTKHRVGTHIAHAGLFVVLLEACLYRADVAKNACLWEVRYDLIKYRECVFEAYGVDY